MKKFLSSVLSILVVITMLPIFTISAFAGEFDWGMAWNGSTLTWNKYQEDHIPYWYRVFADSVRDVQLAGGYVYDGSANFKEIFDTLGNGDYVVELTPYVDSVFIEDETSYSPVIHYVVPTFIDTIDLTYDADVINLNTAWTEGEVNTRIRNNVAITTTGVNTASSSSGLLYNAYPESELTAGSVWGIGYGTSQVSDSRDYILGTDIRLSDGYDWVNTARKETASEISGITVNLNGINVTSNCVFSYNSYWNMLKVYYVMGKASTTPLVTSVNITGSNISVKKGGTHTFEGTVNGTVLDKTIQWSVADAESSSTTISNAGVLSIDKDETASTIKVIAKANADTTKSAFVNVTVLDEDPYIDSVSVSPDTKSVYCGNTQQFTEIVTGTQVDKSVTWSVSGATSANTVISDKGLLTIGSDEAAKTLTVSAIAKQDNTKVGTATVTVVQRERISEINLTYSKSDINLTTCCTEGEVDSRARNNMAVTTTGATIDKSNSGLRYLSNPEAPKEPTNYYGIGYGTNQVSDSKDYALEYCIKLNTEYDWQESVKKNDYKSISGLKVLINGVDVTESCVLNYNSAYNTINVSYVIGKASGHTYTVEVSPAIDATCITEGTTAVMKCANCELTVGGDVIPAKGHNIVIDKAVDETCTKTGLTAGSHCSICGEVMVAQSIISAKGHKLVSMNNGVDATCITAGKQADTKCLVCGIKLITGKIIPAIGHKYTTKVVAATYAAKGYTLHTCTVCNDSYKDNYKNKLTVAKPTISKIISSKSKQLKVTWGKKSYTGYEVQIATNKNFTKNKKSVKITKASTVTKTFTKLKGKTKYFVRVRTYKTYKGKVYYSSWSTVKSVTIKK